MRNTKGRGSTTQELKDGRWEGLHNANHNKGGPVGLGIREERTRPATSVITGRDRATGPEIDKSWGYASRGPRRKWFRARAPRPRTRLNHYTPKTVDTHAGLERLADCRSLLPSFGVPAERHNQHAAQHTFTHIHTPMPCGSAPADPPYRHFRSPPTCHRWPLPFP